MQLSANDLFRPGDGLGASLRTQRNVTAVRGARMVRPPKPTTRARRGYRWVWSPGAKRWKEKKRSTGGIFGKIGRVVGKVGKGAFRVVKGIARPVLRVAGAIALPGVAQAAEAVAEEARQAGAAAGSAAQEDVMEAQATTPGGRMGNILPIAALAVGAYLLMGKRGRR